VTLTVKEDEPGTVGVPLMAPEVERRSPSGNADPVKLYGAVPPVTEIWAEYATPTLPEISVPPRLNPGGPDELTVSEKLLVKTAPVLSPTVTLKL
jgi:hypothetical protein